jgi:hypothetical protein
MNSEEEFWLQVNIKSANDCWNWIGKINSDHKIFKYNKKLYTSSQLVWFLTYEEVPDSMIFHSCNNKICCNPKHLFIETLDERFWSKVDIKNENDCWNWLASTNSDGYGEFRYKNKLEIATHMVWFLTYGKMPTLQILHTCDNPSCCNPNHLFEGTNIDNINDRVNKNRSAVGNKHGTHTHPESLINAAIKKGKLKEDDIIKILTMYYFEHIKPKEIHVLYNNLDKTTITDIIYGKTWKNISNKIFPNGLPQNQFKLSRGKFYE